MVPNWESWVAGESGWDDMRRVGWDAKKFPHLSEHNWVLCAQGKNQKLANPTLAIWSAPTWLC